MVNSWSSSSLVCQLTSSLFLKHFLHLTLGTPTLQAILFPHWSLFLRFFFASFPSSSWLLNFGAPQRLILGPLVLFRIILGDLIQAYVFKDHTYTEFNLDFFSESLGNSNLPCPTLNLWFCPSNSKCSSCGTPLSVNGNFTLPINSSFRSQTAALSLIRPFLHINIQFQTNHVGSTCSTYLESDHFSKSSHLPLWSKLSSSLAWIITVIS